MKHFTLTVCVAAALTACGAGGAQKHEATDTALQGAPFDADTAYTYVKQQVEFGPRVPATNPHLECGTWIETQLQRHQADSVWCQLGQAPDGTPIRNIMARYRGTDADAAPVLLLAHYDTRPMADEDPDPSKRNLPIDGANDGASGVAVLLETARQLGLKRAPVTIDLLFVDAEDGGTSGNDDSWCLGSQYFAAHMPYGDTRPRYAVLLDMVGGIGARFHREYFSDLNARPLVDRVWSIAAQLGYGQTFVNEAGGGVIDDHRPLQNIGIPAIDIVESRADATGTFPAHWHTTSDNINAISPNTLRQVGITVNTLIYNEK